jgi:hypothetical protein
MDRNKGFSGICYLLRGYVILDPILNSLQDTFSRDGRKIGILKDRVYNADILRTDFRRYCQQVSQIAANGGKWPLRDMLGRVDLRLC